MGRRGRRFNHYRSIKSGRRLVRTAISTAGYDLPSRRVNRLHDRSWPTIYIPDSAVRLNNHPRLSFTTFIPYSNVCSLGYLSYSIARIVTLWLWTDCTARVKRYIFSYNPRILNVLLFCTFNFSYKWRLTFWESMTHSHDTICFYFEWSTP